jgi:hypothetical protein
VPVELIIPSRNIDEKNIQPIKVQRGSSCGSGAPYGCLIPPKDTIGWDPLKPLPGDPGISVIAGHDEWNGPSDFWNLKGIQLKADIIVVYKSGMRLTFATNGFYSELKVENPQDKTIPNTVHDPLIWGSNNTPFRQIAIGTCDKDSPIITDNTGKHHTENFWVHAYLVSVSG